jgi:transcriptional regulator with XRE-family HTH domain
MVTHSEIDPKALLAELLREVRQQSQYRSQEALARAIGKERSAVSKPEQGERVPAIDVLGDILTACEVTGLARLAIEGIARLGRTWDDPATARIAPWYSTEARAHTLRYWAPILVPGPFQTAAYAEELFRAMGFDEAKVAESLERRLRRQEILTRDNAPDITIVLWEPVVLHHQIGSRDVMRDQCKRLLEVSSLPTVNLHILTSSIGANPGLGGAINLAATDDAPELLLSDGLVEDSLSQEPSVVHQARTTLSHVRGDALNRIDSRAKLQEAQETWSR